MFDIDHITGDFNKAVRRAELLMVYGATFSEACRKLAETCDREFAYLACVGARTSLKMDPDAYIHRNMAVILKEVTK